MKCADFRRDLYAVNPFEATAAFRASMLRHANTCDECGRFQRQAAQQAIEETGPLTAEEREAMEAVVESDSADPEVMEVVFPEEQP